MKKSIALLSITRYAAIAAILLSVVLAICPRPAQAKLSGRTLMEQCISNLTVAQSVCTSYIQGLIEGHTLSTGGAMGQAKFFCVPPNASAGKVKKVIVKYLRKNAAELERNAGELVYQALAEAWPC